MQRPRPTQFTNESQPSYFHMTERTHPRSVVQDSRQDWSSTNPQAARMTVKLDGDIIMGEIAATADKRYLNPQYGSLEDMGLVQKIKDEKITKQ